MPSDKPMMSGSPFNLRKTLRRLVDVETIWMPSLLTDAAVKNIVLTLTSRSRVSANSERLVRFAFEHLHFCGLEGKGGEDFCFLNLFGTVPCM